MFGYNNTIGTDTYMWINATRKSHIIDGIILFARCCLDAISRLSLAEGRGCTEGRALVQLGASAAESGSEEEERRGACARWTCTQRVAFWNAAYTRTRG